MFVPVVFVKGQYNHLIARTLQDLGVESRLLPSTTPAELLNSQGADALVMGGGPQRVRTVTDLTEELSAASRLIKEANLPLMCICVTHQLLATVYGGETDAATKPEFGPVKITVANEGEILTGLKPSFTAWESHNDEIVKVPSGFNVLASSQSCKIQAMGHDKLPVFGVQFHPEVSHTEKGAQIFKNFLTIVRK